MLDLAPADGDPLAHFDAINREVALYDPALAERPMVVAANKMDLPDAAGRYPGVERALEARGYEVVPISGLTGEGVDRLLALIARHLPT